MDNEDDDVKFLDMYNRISKFSKSFFSEEDIKKAQQKFNQFVENTKSDELSFSYNLSSMLNTEFKRDNLLQFHAVKSRQNKHLTIPDEYSLKWDPTTQYLAIVPPGEDGLPVYKLQNSEITKSQSNESDSKYPLHPHQEILIKYLTIGGHLPGKQTFLNKLVKDGFLDPNNLVRAAQTKPMLTSAILNDVWKTIITQDEAICTDAEKESWKTMGKKPPSQKKKRPPSSLLSKLVKRLEETK